MVFYVNNIKMIFLVEYYVRMLGTERCITDLTVSMTLLIISDVYKNGSLKSKYIMAILV